MSGNLLELLGAAGIVLVVLSAFSFYLSVRNGIFLFLVNRDFRRQFAALEKGNSVYAQWICRKHENPLLDIIAGITQTHAAHSKDIRAEVAYMFQRNFGSVINGLTYLRLISVIAPLLGLLGTMFGMVRVFRSLVESGHHDYTLLASGIWEALITTIMGLSVAIPTLAAYYYLSLKLKQFRIEAVEHSYRTIDLLGISCSQVREAYAVEPQDEKRSTTQVIQGRARWVERHL